jgi:uncharacterized membrane protein
VSSRFPAPTRLTWVAMGATVLSIAATAGFLGWAYGELPAAVPVRYIRGEPVVYQFKSLALVMLPVGVQLALLTVFGALMTLILWRARPGDDRHAGAGDVERMQHAAEGIALLGGLWIAFQGFGAWRLIELWFRGRGGYGEIYSFALVTAIVVSVVIAARTMKLVGRHRAPAGVPIDPAHWVGGLYVNPRDPALYVPTRTRAGWTLNFGRPVAIVIMLAVLLLGFGVPGWIAVKILRGYFWW